MNHQRVAVTTDFSDESRKTFPVAASLAWKLGQGLVVIHQARPLEHILPPAVAPVERPLEEAHYLEALESRLKDLVSSEPSFEGLDAESRLIPDWGTSALAEALENEGTPCLVLATHGYTGAKHVLFGSFTEKVVRAAPCPVLVYRTLDGLEPPADFAPNRILVTTISRP